MVFLEECVRHGACLPDCAGVAEQEMEHLPADGFEYWDYRNILRLSQTRARLRETPADRPAVSLSGGNSNGLAHLGALENLAGSDGTIASSVGVIAGTSMGGIMAVLAAVAPLRDIQRDIMEGFELDGRSYHLRGNTAIESDRERIMEFFIALGRRHGIDEGTRFSDLPIPVVVAASRDTLRGAQKILLGGDDAVIDALRAASNFRSPLTGRPLFGETRVDGVLLTDDAANEEGNSIDTLERLGAPYRRMVAVDVGYSSDRYDAPATRGERAGVRRMFKLATTRDTLWKATTVLAGGSVVDIDTAPSANMRGERFAPECSRRMFEIGRAAWTPARSSDKSSDIRTMPA